MPTLAKIISRACFSLTAVSLTAVAAQPARAQAADTSFFVTSVGIGNGGNLGGLAGADNYCQTLARAAGAGGKTWHAYLSTQAADGTPAVNARDRIGKGPWQNVKGVVIAKDVTELHNGNNIPKQTALTEKGEVNNGYGDQPNRHDILTGSQPDGTAFTGPDDHTCKNWTSSTQGAAMLGQCGASLARTGWRLLAGRPKEHRRRRAVVLFRGQLKFVLVGWWLSPVSRPSVRGAKATKQSILRRMNCFAEPVIGRAVARPVGSQ